MNNLLRIGEYESLGSAPFFFPLKKVLRRPEWSFVTGTPDELADALEAGELDLALISPLTIAAAPLDYQIFPDLGYAARRHIRDVLLFSDMYLDDMDEMTVALPAKTTVTSSIMRIVLEQYLQYQINFILGWGQAEAYVLEGDSALRERALARYAYVYDVGDLWRHYTGKAMIYQLWAIRADAAGRKRKLISDFHAMAKKAIALVRDDWLRLASLTKPNYDWVKKSVSTKLWSNVDYKLEACHFEGLKKFFEDCVDLGVLDEAPELEFFND